MIIFAYNAWFSFGVTCLSLGGFSCAFKMIEADLIYKICLVAGQCVTLPIQYIVLYGKATGKVMNV